MSWAGRPGARPDPGPENDADAELDGLVDVLLGGKPRPVNWAALHGPAAAAQWALLDEWVGWLAARYALDQRELPPCWYRHPALVEELSALRTAHLGAYDPGGAPTGPADWHHTLAAVRARLRDWASRTGCRPGEHRDDTPQLWAATPTAGASATDPATPLVSPGTRGDPPAPSGECAGPPLPPA